MLILPAIDLRDGCCVRLSQGRKETAKFYDGNPIEIGKAYEAEGAEMLHIVDLDGAFSEPNSRNRQVLGELARQLNIPLQFGGGLRKAGDVEQVIDLGVERVVLGTIAVEDPKLLAHFVNLFGGARLAVGIDARNGLVATRGWESEGEMSASALATRVGQMGIERIVYTDILRDGMLSGPNIEQTRNIAVASRLKVTASGGVSALEDVEHLKTLAQYGVDSVIVGKALYEKRFTLSEALRAATR